MDENITAAITKGATLTVRAHDTLNPGCGYFARLEDARGHITGLGDTASDAVAQLAEHVRGIGWVS